MNNPTWKIESFDPNEPLPHEGETIILLTPTELERVPDGVAVLNIFGREFIKGVDRINNDTRGGYLAYGTLTGDE